MPAIALRHFENFRHSTMDLEEARHLVERGIIRGLIHPAPIGGSPAKPPAAKRKVSLNWRDFVTKTGSAHV